MGKWWMVRAGDNNELIPIWRDKGVASIGWSDLGNPNNYSSRDKMIQKAHLVYHKDKPGGRIQSASQVWRFYKEIQVNDRVISYSKDTREYIIGTVLKSHQFAPTLVSDYYPNVIGVKWEDKTLSRDLLSRGAKNSLGSTMTVFRVDDWGSEIETLISGGVSIVSPSEDKDVEEELTEDSSSFIQQALTMVEDAVNRLDPWEMQELVGGLLRAMGYRVKVSPKGPDGGVDILAHRDSFGFEQPIIKVQVKHRNSTTGSPEVQQLIGASPNGASCLFVSTGGYSASAKSLLHKHSGLKLLDLAELVELLMEWYEQLPPEIQALIPLKRVYVPFYQN